MAASVDLSLQNVCLDCVLTAVRVPVVNKLSGSEEKRPYCPSVLQPDGTETGTRPGAAIIGDLSFLLAAPGDVLHRDITALPRRGAKPTPPEAAAWLQVCVVVFEPDSVTL